MFICNIHTLTFEQSGVPATMLFSISTLDADHVPQVQVVVELPSLTYALYCQPDVNLPQVVGHAVHKETHK